MNAIHNEPALRQTSSVKRNRAQTRTQKVNRRARLVFEANCTRCRRIRGACTNPWLAAKRAVDHAARTGHVVILNGTADVPDAA
jgi:hypothetical protein